MDPFLDPASPVRVERVSLRGPGVIVLAGPSGCGKGELAAALCMLMTIPPERHLSMGEILRTTVEQARADEAFAHRLEQGTMISARDSILDCIDTSPELGLAVRRHLPDIDILFRDRHGDGTSPRDFVSQLDWLEFCTRRGLLVPDRWTAALMEARIDALAREGSAPILVDGHPRTLAAARQLLAFLEDRRLPVLKLIRLSVGEGELRARARRRGRVDDDDVAIARRMAFFAGHVDPAIEHLARVLGETCVARIDADPPPGLEEGAEAQAGAESLDVGRSIARVVRAALRSLGVPAVVARDLSEAWRCARQTGAAAPGTE